MSQKYLWMVTNQCASSLNRGLSPNFAWLRRANHIKFTETMCDVLGKKHVLVKKILQMG